MATKTAICWVILLCPFLSYSQTDNGYFDFKEPVPPTPNVSSLGKYGDIPVSLHTGVPNISIPIYTIKEGDISLGISLNYHSSGVKVDEIASWVGLGWSLNAGGMITRTVAGGPDEGHKALGKAISSIAGHGWYKDEGIPDEITNCRLTPSNPVPQSGCAECVCVWYYYDAANGLVDTEPDIYSYSVNGISGKFYFDENRNPVMHPITDVKIITDFNSATNEFEGWQLIGPDGTQYLFGGENDNVENGYSSFQGLPGFLPEYKSTTTWYLDKIVSANRQDTIFLEYEKERYGYGNRISQSVSVNSSSCQITGDVLKAPEYLMFNSVDGVRLNRVRASSGNTTVNFNSNNLREDVQSHSNQYQANLEAKYLSSIDIQSGNFCKEFILEHSYFESDPSSGYPNDVSPYNLGFDLKRLRLKSIQEISCNQNESIPPYRFIYNETPLPRRYSLARDHWGYYNGATSNQSLIPSVSYLCIGNQFNFGNSNRNPNESYLKAGVLEKVQYPTGGSTEFIYEGHRVNDNELIGGLRIKSQVSYDENENVALVKGYEYLESRLYSGNVEYVSYPGNSYWGAQYGVAFNVMIGSSPKPALQSTQGYHVGYGEVRIHQAHGGYETHRFNNVTPSPSFGFPMPPSVSRIGAASLNRLSYSNAESQEVFSKFSQYNYDDNRNISGMRISSLCPTANPGCGNTPNIFYTDYAINTSRFRIQYETQVQDGLTTTTNYQYNQFYQHDNPIEIVTTNSQGETLKTEIQYTREASATLPAEMVERNMINIPIVTKQFNSDLMTKMQTNQFQLENDMVLLKETEVLPIGLEEGKISLRYTYDTRGRIKEQYKTDDIPTAYIWNQTGTYVIASVVNADDGEVYYEGFEDSGIDSSMKAKAGRYVHNQSSYTIPAVQRPSGSDLVMTYWYYKNGNWVFQDEIPYSSTITVSGASAIDEFMVYPKDAQMTTYSYDSSGLVLSQGDPNGQYVHYEYDDLSRLILIRDHNEDILQSTSYHYSQN